jgi:predicted nucleotide-binding protein
MVVDTSKIDPRNVFVVYGRDNKINLEVMRLLRDLDLHPLDWSEIKSLTGSASPHILQILEKGFSVAQASVVIMTPDELAHLRSQFVGPRDDEQEKKPSKQSRPNVLFEAGMAMAYYADRTVFLEFDRLRKFSDMAGLNIIYMSDSSSKIQEIISALKTAKCAVKERLGVFDEKFDFTPTIENIESSSGESVYSNQQSALWNVKITIDMRSILYSDGALIDVPYQASAEVSSLLDFLFEFYLAGSVPGRSYGTHWAFRDRGTGQLLLGMGRAFARGRDARRVADVGVRAGMQLVVERLVSPVDSTGRSPGETPR